MFFINFSPMLGILARVWLRLEFGSEREISQFWWREVWGKGESDRPFRSNPKSGLNTPQSLSPRRRTSFV